MAKIGKPKTYWLGLVTFVYAFFLFCQGIWTYINYLFIYPAVYFVIPGYDYKWIYAMGYFTMALVIIAPIVGGLILMWLGFWLMFGERKTKMRWVSVTLFVYSSVLLFQTIWVLFGYPKFYSELYRYASTDVFINFPRFFILLGAVVPPLVGSIFFIIISLYLLKAGVKERQQLISEN